MQLVRTGVEPGRQARLRGVHLLSGAGRGGEHVVRLHLGLPVVAIEPGDRLAGRVGTAGILEVREPGKRWLAKGRKLRTDEVEVEVHGRVPCGRPGIIDNPAAGVNVRLLPAGAERLRGSACRP